MSSPLEPRSPMGKEMEAGGGLGVLSTVLRFLWHPVTIVTVLGTLLFIAGTASGIYFHSNPGLITAVGILSVMIVGFCTWVVHRMGMSAIVQLIEVLTVDASVKASDVPAGFSGALPGHGLESLGGAVGLRRDLRSVSVSQRIRAGEKSGQLGAHWWQYVESNQLLALLKADAHDDLPLMVSYPAAASTFPAFPPTNPALAPLPEPRMNTSPLGSAARSQDLPSPVFPPPPVVSVAGSRDGGVVGGGGRRNIRLSDNVTQFPPPSLSVTPTTHNDDAEESAYTFAHSTSERGSALVERRGDDAGASTEDSSETEDGLEAESERTTSQATRNGGPRALVASTTVMGSPNSGRIVAVSNPIPTVVSPLAARRRLGDLQPILLGSATASGRHNSFAADTASLSMAATGTALTVSPPKGPTTQGSPTLMELLDSDASLDAEPDFSHLTGDSFSAARQQHLRGPSSVDPDYEFRHDGERPHQVEEQRTQQESEQEPGTDLSAYRRRAHPTYGEKSRNL